MNILVNVQLIRHQFCGHLTVSDHQLTNICNCLDFMHLMAADSYLLFSLTVLSILCVSVAVCPRFEIKLDLLLMLLSDSVEDHKLHNVLTESN